MGFFDSMDPSSWGLAEWLVLGGGLFLIFGGGGVLFKKGRRRYRSAAVASAQRDLSIAQAKLQVARAQAA